jgi:hypothetical protein
LTHLPATRRKGCCEPGEKGSDEFRFGVGDSAVEGYKLHIKESSLLGLIPGPVENSLWKTLVTAQLAQI